ncbi:ATP-binding protein [Thalassotalea algicola]|nr:ATP-binding protein [Thalassotalea algicola]
MAVNNKFIHWLTQSGGGIRVPLLITFSVLWLFSFAVLFFISYNNANELVQQSISEKFEEVFLFYDEKIAEQAKIQELALFHLSQNEAILSALQASDRSKLITLSKPIFKELNKTNFITHFYFIAVDKTVIYRAHAPQRMGDIITRETLKRASENNYVASGMEFGVLGTFTLRSVKPVFINAKLIGYIELGMEIGHVIRQTEHQFNIDIVELIDINLVNNNVKEAIYKLTGRVSDEALVSDYLTIHARNKELDTFRRTNLNEVVKSILVSGLKFEFDNGYAFMYQPIIDFVGNNIGKFIVFTDVSLALEKRNNSLQQAIAFLLLMFVVGFLIFNFVLVVIDNQIKNYQKDLFGQRSNLKATIKQLKSTQAQLIEKEKFAALGNLVAGVAHEVNTPIGMGVTASTFLQDRITELKLAFEREELTAKQLEKFVKEGQETSQIIFSNLARAADLVSSFKQVAVDQSSDQHRKFNVVKLIDEVILSLRPHLKKTNHQIHVNCDKNLSIDSIPGALSQIIINLIMNSIIHGFEQTNEGEVTIDITVKDNHFYLNYKDNGKGIPEEFISRVFEPFVTTKRGEGGTGLGMHLVYNLVTQALDGDVRLYSQVDNGVSLDITFPIQNTG